MSRPAKRRSSRRPANATSNGSNPVVEAANAGTKTIASEMASKAPFNTNEVVNLNNMNEVELISYYASIQCDADDDGRDVIGFDGDVWLFVQSAMEEASDMQAKVAAKMKFEQLLENIAKMQEQADKLATLLSTDTEESTNV